MRLFPLYVVVSPLVRCLTETFSSLSQEEISLQLRNLFPVKLNRRIRFPERACGRNKGLLPISLAVHTELGTQVANFVCPKLRSWVYTNVRVQSPHREMTRGFRDAHPQKKISLEVPWGSPMQANKEGPCHSVSPDHCALPEFPRPNSSPPHLRGREGDPSQSLSQRGCYADCIKDYSVLQVLREPYDYHGLG